MAQDPAHWRDIINQLLTEQQHPDDDEEEVDLDSIESDRQKRKDADIWHANAYKRWGPDYKPPVSHGRQNRYTAEYHFEWEKEVPDTDNPGETEVIYLDLVATVSGTYHKGYKGSYYDPPEPAGFEDIEVDDISFSDREQEKLYPLSYIDKAEIEDYLLSKKEDHILDALNDANG